MHKFQASLEHSEPPSQKKKIEERRKESIQYKLGVILEDTLINQSASQVNGNPHTLMLLTKLF